MSKFDKKCSKCRNYNGNILICESCDHYKPKLTVFGSIMQSEEKLAEKLVYEQVVINTIQINDSYSSHNEGSYMKMWKSALLPMKFFDDKQKALEATLEELKKEVES